MFSPYMSVIWHELLRSFQEMIHRWIGWPPGNISKQGDQMVGQFFWWRSHVMSGLMLLVFTYREVMQIVLQYNHRRRPIISLPFQVGVVQGAILEKLPVNLFTITRAQVCSEDCQSSSANVRLDRTTEIGQHC